MNNQELAALCRIEIRHWQSVPDKQYMVDLLELALEALTAEPLKVPDVIEPHYEVIKRILPTANPDEYACCVGADMWNACRAEVLRLNAIDNTAQQYEALAKEADNG